MFTLVHHTIWVMYGILAHIVEAGLAEEKE